VSIQSIWDRSSRPTDSTLAAYPPRDQWDDVVTLDAHNAMLLESPQFSRIRPQNAEQLPTILCLR